MGILGVRYCLKYYLLSVVAGPYANYPCARVMHLFLSVCHTYNYVCVVKKTCLFLFCCLEIVSNSKTLSAA